MKRVTLDSSNEQATNTLVPVAGTHSSTSLIPVRRCSSAKEEWNDLRFSLNINAPGTQPTSMKVLYESASENELKEKALKVWSDHEKCEAILAPLLYELWKRLRAPGSKGQGFDAWLRENKKSRSTAYRWIGAYAEREGLPRPDKSKTRKSVSHGTNSPTTDNEKLEVEAEYIPAPTTVCEAKNALTRLFQGLEGKNRRAAAEELIEWIESAVLNEEAAKPEGVNAELSA